MADQLAGPVGFLHPGAMGAKLAAICTGERLWLPSGRSPESTRRAKEASLRPCETLEALAGACTVIVSVCPPNAAEQVAADVARAGFVGLYVDANAIAPATARRISDQFEHFIDGGIIGPPPTTAGTTRLYLSGERASEIAALWEDSALEVRLVDGGAGAASAVKVCFAAWTKGSAALLLAIRALAEAEGITDSIVGEWQTSMPDLITRAEHTAKAVGPKAWRFAGEMEEIAAAFAAKDLPSGFHGAAAELYKTLDAFKDRSPGPSLEDILRVLGDGTKRPQPQQVPE